jgi:hypothetical protein
MVDVRQKQLWVLWGSTLSPIGIEVGLATQLVKKVEACSMQRHDEIVGAWVQQFVTKIQHLDIFQF